MTKNLSTAQRCGRYLFSAVFVVSCLAIVQACSSDVTEDVAADDPSELIADEATPEAAAGTEAAEDSAELATLEQAVTSCSSSAQCASGNACTSATCQAGQCLVSNRPAGTSCGNGLVCSGTGVCVVAAPPGCTSNAQCAAGGVCTTGACQAGQCVVRAAPAGTPCQSIGICSAASTCIIIR